MMIDSSISAADAVGTSFGVSSYSSPGILFDANYKVFVVCLMVQEALCFFET